MVNFILKFVKTLFKAFFILLILGIIAVLLTVTFINPNKYKTELCSLVKQATGREFKINGNIQWSLSPQITFYIRDSLLANNPEFTNNLIEAKEASVAISLSNLLFKREIFIQGLELKGIKINLIKNANGKTNVDDFISKSETSKSSKNNNYIKQIKVDKLLLQNSEIYIEDKTQNNLIQLKNLNLKLKNSKDLDFSGIIENNSNKLLINNLLAKLDLANKTLDIYEAQLNHNSLNYKLQSKVQYVANKIAATGNIKLLPVNLATTFNIKQSLLPTALTANVDFNFADNALELTPLTINLDDGKINGKIKLHEFQNFASTGGKILFDIASNNVELEKLCAVYPVLANVFNNNQNNDKTISNKTKIKHDISGKFQAENLVIKSPLQIDKLTFNLLNPEKGVYQVEPLNITGPGNHKISAKIDTRTKDLIVNLNIDSVQADLTNFSKALLNDRLSGTGSASIKLLAIGSDVNHLLNNLTGNINLLISNGHLSGADIIAALKLIETELNNLIDLIKNSSNTDNNKTKLDIPGLIANKIKALPDLAGNNAKTPFTNLKFQANLQNGIANKALLTIHHPQYSVQGFGLINLANNLLDYSLSARLNKNDEQKQKEVLKYMENVPVLVTLKGSITDVKISIDKANYIKNAMQELQKHILKDVVKQAIQNKVDDLGVNINLDHNLEVIDSIFNNTKKKK